MLDQILQQLVRQSVLVGPLRIAEDAVEVLLVGRLDRRAWRWRARCRRSSVRGAHVRPVAALGHLEAVLVGEVLAILGEHRGVLLVPHVADALEEEQRQDVRLPVGAVDRAAAQDVGGLPEVRLELSECHP